MMQLKRIGAWVLLGLASGASHAQNTFDWALSGGVDHSDNIRRTSQAEESESTVQAGLLLDVDRERPRYDLGIAADLRLLDYLDDTFGSEVRGEFDGRLRVTLAGERLTWSFRDRYGQILNDPRQTDTPDNRGDINYFETGPDIALPLGGLTTLQLQGRWADASYEEPGADSQRLTGGFRLLRRLSEGVTSSLNGSATRVEFDPFPTANDYDVQETSLGIEATGARTTISARAGYTVLRDRGESDDSLLVNLTFDRRIGVRTRLNFQGGRGFSDVANAFQLDQSFDGVALATRDAGLSNDPFLADYAYVGWTMEWGRSTLEITGTWRDESYETRPESDRSLYGLRLDWSRRLSPRVSLDLWSSFRQDEFTAVATDLEELEGGAGVDWSLGPQFGINVQVSHITGNRSIGDVGDYEENRAYIGFVYSDGARDIRGD